MFSNGPSPFHRGETYLRHVSTIQRAHKSIQCALRTVQTPCWDRSPSCHRTFTLLSPCRVACHNRTGANPNAEREEHACPDGQCHKALGNFYVIILSGLRQAAVGEPLSRLYASILVQRLVHFTEQHDLRSPTQAGYRPEHSTIHQAFVLQHVIDKHRCLKTPLYLCFVNLKSSYDRVQWPLLWDLLRRLGVHGKMLGAVQSLYDNCLLFMRVSGFTGEGRTPSMGLRQVPCLACSLMACIITWRLWLLLLEYTFST